MHIRAQASAEQLVDELARLTLMPRERIYVGEAGAVLACHGGRGVVAAVGLTAT